MQSKGVGKFCSKQNKRLDLLAVDVLNGFYCILFLCYRRKHDQDTSWSFQLHGFVCSFLIFLTKDEHKVEHKAIFNIDLHALAKLLRQRESAI